MTGFAPYAFSCAPEPELIWLRALSLGAGVQSTTLALMAAHGKIGPMPDCAIFSDTGWEPKAVYAHLDWLRSDNVLPFPVHVVSAGNIRDDLVACAQGRRAASIPAFTRNVTPAGTEVPVFD
jgi:3'-phosphoadenosine 5'-phosphosulfate sulfotransferase (PAPS reductase)/FAD synthetase